jgi:ribosomal protein L37AE/L43A
MTKDEALKLALEALDVVKLQYTQNRHVNEAIKAIKEASAQPEQEPTCPECKAAVLYECVACSSNNYPPKPVQEPVARTVIAGALFDFMGYLTSRKERIVLSAADDAAPAADAIIDFATKRGLSLDDAQVREWIDALAQPEERNFCPRCGKRTADPTTIHTCTPPQGNT